MMMKLLVYTMITVWLALTIQAVSSTESSESTDSSESSTECSSDADCTPPEVCLQPENGDSDDSADKICLPRPPRNPCRPNPCQNGGRCVSGETYTCECPAGYTGRECQDEIPPEPVVT